jgi:filamentous hemagglutinin
MGGMVLMDPGDIRFTQNSISSTFKDGTNVGETIDALRTGKTSPLDIEPIRTFQRNGQTFTLDNRRLFAASEAGTQIATRPATGREILSEGFKKFTTQTGGRFVGVRGVVTVLTRGRF